MKYLGIDYGHKKVGYAESDEMGMMAFPMMICENNASLLKDTLEVVRALSVGVVVIGESLDKDGTPNKIASEARSFGKSLEDSGVTVAFEKEWFTTSEARRQPDAMRDVDDAAAALILQRYLEKLNPKKFEASEQEEDEIEE